MSSSYGMSRKAYRWYRSDTRNLRITGQSVTANQSIGGTLSVLHRSCWYSSRSAGTTHEAILLPLQMQRMWKRWGIAISRVRVLFKRVQMPCRLGPTLEAIDWIDICSPWYVLLWKAGLVSYMFADWSPASMLFHVKPILSISGV